MTHPAAAPGMTLDAAKARIQELFKLHPRIRISVAIAHTKVVQDAEVTITGVYSHVFCVEEHDNGTPQRHTFQYADLITHRVEILDPA